jgi:hypothetical protein
MTFNLNVKNFDKKPALKRSTYDWLVGDVLRRAESFFPSNIKGSSIRTATEELVACLDHFCDAELALCADRKKTRSGWLSIQFHLLQLNQNNRELMQDHDDHLAEDEEPLLLNTGTTELDALTAYLAEYGNEKKFDHPDETFYAVLALCFASRAIEVLNDGKVYSKINASSTHNAVLAMNAICMAEKIKALRPHQADEERRRANNNERAKKGGEAKNSANKAMKKQAISEYVESTHKSKTSFAKSFAKKHGISLELRTITSWLAGKENRYKKTT